MKKNYSFFIALFMIANAVNAAQFNVSVSGLSYSPATTNAAVGDTINFSASSTHPCVEVSQASWANNMSTPLPGGFGVHTSNFSYVIPTSGTIYFVCQNHVGAGMKGQIVATASNINEIAGVNAITLLSSTITQNQATVLNSTGKSCTMELYDLSGKTVDQLVLTAEERQQVAIDLKSGVYLYRFIADGIKPQAAERLYIGK